MVGFFTDEQVKTVGRSTKKALSCVSCGRHAQCDSPKFGVYGEGKKKILNVLPFPTKMQDVKCDVTMSGDYVHLTRMLQKNKIDIQKDCYTVFAVRCASAKKAEPAQDQIEACRIELFQTIQELAPKLILAFGDVSVKSIIGATWHKNFGTFSKWEGWVIPDQTTNAWVAPLSTPTVYKQGKEYETLWNMYFEEALKYLHLPMPCVDSEKYEIVTNEKQIAKTLRRINNFARHETIYLSFDYETSGLKPHDSEHEIFCIGFTYRFRGEIYTCCFPPPLRPEGKRLLQKVLRNPSIKKIAHNLKFEQMWTQNILGYSVRPWEWDSLLAAHILDSRDGVKSLKFQTYVHFGVAGYDDLIQPYLEGVDPKNSNSKNRLKEFVKHPKNYIKLMEYCALDSLYTLLLAEKQQGIVYGRETDEFTT